MHYIQQTLGLSHKRVNFQIRRSQNYFEDREVGPRFALPGSFEYEYAQRFKDLWKSYDVKTKMLKSEEENEERKLDMDVMRASYDHETERLKELIRQREMEKDRFRQKLDDQIMTKPKQDCHELVDRKGDLRPNELFMHANQLSNILDNEEREIQVMSVYNLISHHSSNLHYNFFIKNKRASIKTHILIQCVNA